MKFPRDHLIDLVGFCDVPGYEVIKDEITDTSRWSIHRSMVFKFDGRYFATHYSEGATEQQNEYPFEYEDEFVECQEVEPVEVTVTEYRIKEQ